MKRDKLPSRELLYSRKEHMIYYWKKLRDVHRIRFDMEAGKITGSEILSDNWQNTLFNSVSEAIEVTAIQKGCERWQP